MGLAPTIQIRADSGFDRRFTVKNTAQHSTTSERKSRASSESMDVTFGDFNDDGYLNLYTAPPSKQFWLPISFVPTS